MSAGRAYLDHNATAPLRPEVHAAMVHALGLPGNPSSIHGDGRAARAVVEAARDQVAALVAARPRDVFFTSGGTEAAATVLTPGLARDGIFPTLLLVSATEHACVLAGHRFAAEQVETLPVDGSGLVNLAWLEARLARHAGMALVSVHAANNETGVIQPIPQISAIASRQGGILHVDTVQAAGRVPVDARALGADVLTLSAHKFGGPKGVGAVIMAGRGLALHDRLMRGGGQERGHRAGTENVPAIAGFGAAAEAVLRDFAPEMARQADLRGTFEQGLIEIEPETTIFGAQAPRLPNTSAFAVPGLIAANAVILFDLDGVSLSSGSACSSGKVQRSHVLMAMGVADGLADAALRVSFGWSSTRDDVALGLATARRIIDRHKTHIQAAA